MVARRLSLILSLLALPSLIGCSGQKAPAPAPPPSRESLAAITRDPGIGKVRLGRAIDALFNADEVGETRALLVLHGGQVVAERYGEGFGPRTRQLGWSLSHCVTGIAIGLLVSDGRLRLDETAPVPAWQRSGDPRGEITVRQLLQMRSGLRHGEDADPHHASDTARMLFTDGRDDMAAFAEAQPLEAEPGRTFEYSSASSLILADVAARALTGSTDPEVRRRLLGTYLRTRLLDPAGMTSLVPEFDAAGTLIGASMMHATPRDWARLGEFLRNNGSVRGAQIVPRRWMEFMLTPSPRNAGYGAHVWLNRKTEAKEPVLFPGKAPRSLFACIGNLGQYVIGSPTQKLTVVRMGMTSDEKRPALRRRLQELVALFPKS